MNAHADFSGADPRLALSPDELTMASLRAAPEVARPVRGGADLTLIAGGLGALALGAVTLIALSHDRRAPAAAIAPLPPPVAVEAGPLHVSALRAAIAAPPPAKAATDPNAVDPNQSRANPMIVDNTGGGVLAADRPAGSAAPAPAAGAQPSALLTGDEQFALRVGGDSGTAHAIGLGNPGYTVMQGTIIPAVLETALNSDLPGYARAIVSRDVRAFDGQRIVIPRGSRLIGQYKSGLATGQSRAFIVWTRLIRPDGASIQLGSPVMDEAGETGVAGRVNRHFLQRFGSAILLSVVGGVTGALSDSSSSTLVIGTGSEAQSAAAQALQTDGKIAPTIRVPPGTPIQVFTARDLDFSGA
jgi:type IV secretion system protein VirB10